MPKFDLDRACDEYRRLTSQLDHADTTAAERRKVEKRIAQLRASYVAWNGGDGDELAEIACGEGGGVDE